MDISWNLVLNNLKASSGSYSLIEPYLKNISFYTYDETSSTVFLSTKSSLVKSVVSRSFLPVIADSCKVLLDKTPLVSILLENEIEKNVVVKKSTEPSIITKEKEQKTNNPSLLKEYTFENFITDENNRFAQAVSLAVSKKPGESQYNPLFIYGSSGLGKTHLLNALGNEFEKNFPSSSILYVSSEEIVTDFYLYTSTNNMKAFKKKYRTPDILLIDDIQFLDSSKSGTVTEVFHTYNTLYNLKKQLVFASDRPPHEILGIDARLSSRLGAGTIANINPPNLETRISILKNYTLEKGIPQTQDLDEVIDFVSSKIKNNVRELIAAINRVLTHSLAFHQSNQINLFIARQALADIVFNKDPISPEKILSSVSMFFEIEKSALLSSSRQAEIVFARQIAIYLIRSLTTSTLKQIGLLFGNRDHSTIKSSIDKISSLKDDPNTKSILDRIQNTL